MSWRDRFAVLWTKANGTPEKLADMVLTQTELRISFDSQALARKTPNIGILQDLGGGSIYAYPRNGSRALPPQLMALLPPDTQFNPQRRILTDLMEASGHSIIGLPTELQQWEMLVFAGRNGIGHLDVFQSDQAAQQYYGAHSDPVPLKGIHLWNTFRQYVTQNLSEVDESLLLQTLGPTPGIAGFVPKLLCQIELNDDASWDGRTRVQPQPGPTGNLVDALVKIEQPAYPGLLELENLAYDYHRQATMFEVPRTWLLQTTVQSEPLIALASERFDRRDGAHLPLESLYSLLHTGNPSTYLSNTDGTIEIIGGVLNLLRLPHAEIESFFARFVMSILTGNGDLHTANLSVLTDPARKDVGRLRLSPIYDPAPMRAYRGRHSHNVLSSLAFGGGGWDTTLSMTPDNLFNFIVAAGRDMGIKEAKAKLLIDHLLGVTRTFADESADLLNSIDPSRRPNQFAPDIAGFNKTLKDVHRIVANGLDMSRTTRARSQRSTGGPL